MVFQKTFKDLSSLQWKIFNGSADGSLFIDNWISLYDNNIAASDVFSLVTNSKRIAGALRFYPTEDLRQIFESTPEPLRLKALEKLGDIEEVDEALLTKLKDKPE